MSIDMNSMLVTKISVLSKINCAYDKVFQINSLSKFALHNTPHDKKHVISAKHIDGMLFSATNNIGAITSHLCTL